MIRAMVSLLALAAAPTPAWAAQNKPDIVMVVWDATRPDHLSPYGYARDTTPNLNRLAREGMVFEQAFTGAPWTVPSIASLFTGMFTHNHQVDYEPENFTLTLPSDALTMAEVMKGAGYRTALYTAQGIYYQQDGFLQGFDEHRKLIEPKIPQAGLDFIQASGDTPAFVILYFLDPHAPYEPRPEHDLWTDHSLPAVNIRGCPAKVEPGDFPEGWVGHCDVNSGDVTLTDTQWDQLRAQYDGELHQNDALLGDLLTGLERQGSLSNTAILFTSDHAEAFNEHDRERTWHRLPYDTILHIPLILWKPGTVPAARVKSTVRSVDVLPTLAELAGTQVARTINGESLLPLARGGANRPAIGTSHFVGAPAFYRGERYKLFFSRTGPSWTELYDLQADPGEQNNLAGNSTILSAVRARMDALITETTIRVDDAGNQEATQEELERLRALGYVD